VAQCTGDVSLTLREPGVILEEFCRENVYLHKNNRRCKMSNTAYGMSIIAVTETRMVNAAAIRVFPRTALLTLVSLASLSFGEKNDSSESFSLVLGASELIGKSRITFVAYQYFSLRGGMLPVAGITGQTPQILVSADGKAGLYLPGDSIHTLSFSGVVDSVIVRNNTLSVEITYGRPVGRKTEGRDVVTLIGFYDTAYVAMNTTVYKLVGTSSGASNSFGIEAFSAGEGRDTIPALMNDAGINLRGYLYYEIWRFNGYTEFIPAERARTTRPHLTGISFYIAKGK
jgi:hypothetical protein